MESVATWPHNICVQHWIKLPHNKFHIAFHMIIRHAFKIQDHYAIIQEIIIGAIYLIIPTVVNL
jgi:hypothetical protein